MPRRATPRTVRRGPFTTTIFRYQGKGAWYFAIIPRTMAPPITRPWGRTPVVATVDGATWETSIWRDAKSDRSLLAVPRKHRGGKGHDDTVTVAFEYVEDED